MNERILVTNRGSHTNSESCQLGLISSINCDRPTTIYTRIVQKHISSKYDNYDFNVRRNQKKGTFSERALSEGLVKSLYEEVSCYPKPGLVDPFHTGSHADMNYSTFMKSIQAISPYFEEMIHLGCYWEGNLKDLFINIRSIGCRAEMAMFNATNGINTHKGAIFLLGILGTATAYNNSKKLDLTSTNIFHTCSQMTFEVLTREMESIKLSPQMTHGEKVYYYTGFGGAREEVLKGFPSLRKGALDYKLKLLACGANNNASNIQTLLFLMTYVNDTNVLSRTNEVILHLMQNDCKKVLELGGIFSNTGRSALHLLDKKCIQNNVSFGGCADLLAATIFIDGLML